MRRILSLILTVFVLAGAFASCGDNSDISQESSAVFSENESSFSESYGDISEQLSSAESEISEASGSESVAESESESESSEVSAPDGDTPAEEILYTPAIPQRLFIADGKEIYTRLYSMYESNADTDSLQREINSLRRLLVGAESEEGFGGADYNGKIYTSGDYTVRTDDELKSALSKAKSGEVIFIPSGTVIDISDLNVTESFNVSLASGVILASDRGINEGGVIKLSHPMGAAIICGNKTTVTGLNILGVVTAYDEGNAPIADIGLRIMGRDVSITNCEIASFSGDAISASANAGGVIDNCYIHHNENGIKIAGEAVKITNSAFFGNGTDCKYSNDVISVPQGNTVLKSAAAPMEIKRVQPDIAISVFPADEYGVFTLLGQAFSGSKGKLREALALHSGTTNYYEFKDSLTIEQDGKVYGIEEDTLLGGGKGYEKIYVSGDYTVRDLQGLKSALAKAKSGQVVFIEGDAQIDLTGCDITVPAGVILASNRGEVLENGETATGAMLFTTVRERETIFAYTGAGVYGITLVGPDTERHMTHLNRGLNAEGNKYTDYYYKLPLTRGISVMGNGVTVANCEIAGFSEAGVYIRASVDVEVHHCFIHHNQRNGFGYGVVIYGATYVDVYANLFNFDRHAIAADGAANSGYNAYNNVHAGTAIYHIFDAHGGGDRGDGTQIACERIDMHNNVFLSDKLPYKKRGTPEEYSKFTQNIVIYPERSYEYRLLYGTNFTCEDNYWGIAEKQAPEYSFENGKRFTLNAGGGIRIYRNLDYIDSKGYSLRYAYFLVFTPKGDGYYISEYGNNLDDGSIYGWNEKIYIEEGGFVMVFTHKDTAPKQLYDAIAARHGVIYNTSLTLDGDYIASMDGATITVIEGE